METVLIISICRQNLKEKRYLFHFKGVYRNHEIKSLILFSEKECFSVGDEYVLWVNVQMIKDKSLLGVIIKARRLDLISSCD